MTEDFEPTETCEDCEWHQQQIEYHLLRVREEQAKDYAEVYEGIGQPRPLSNAKRLLDAAVQAQLQHQRSHDPVA